jgi:DNA (cytosine-5)-methyltransferase 1
MNYTFMDFCAGIGCWRLWLESAWFECVAFSEIDKRAEQTYRTFFGDDEVNYGDLMKIDTSKLPDFDLLIAGFPCQTFSVMWQRKWMEDPRWQVIFGIKKILQEKNIKYFILENVKWLVNHDGWKTIQGIVDLLDEAWYHVKRKVLNTIDYWLPQSRERVYFLWVRKDLWPFNYKLQFPEPHQKVSLDDYLIEQSDEYYFDESRTTTMVRYLNNKYNNWSHMIEHLLEKEWYIIDTRQSDVRFYKGFSPTLRTWRHGLVYAKNWKLREISWLESLLLQWIPYNIAIKAVWNILDKDLLWQAWNAMSVNVIWALAKEFMQFITFNKPSNGGFSSVRVSNSKKLIPEWAWYYRDLQQVAA